MVSIQTGGNLLYTGMAAARIGPPDPKFTPGHQQVRATRHPSESRSSRLAQGSIKQEHTGGDVGVGHGPPQLVIHLALIACAPCIDEQTSHYDA